MSWARRDSLSPIHGWFWARLSDTSGLDPHLSFKWLMFPCLKPTTEASILAAQDQALNTRNFQYAVVGAHSRASASCRLCASALEMIDHLVAA